MDDKQVVNQDNPRYAANGQTKAELTARLPKPGPGRGKESEKVKLVRKAVKELVKEYQESLANALPKISPVLIRESLKGNIPAVKELNDRVMGKAPQKTDITSAGKPIPLLAGITKINGDSNNSDEEVAETEE